MSFISAFIKWISVLRHRRIRVMILLPLYYNPDEAGNRKEIEPEKLYNTRNELTAQYGGVTVTNSLNSGCWDNPRDGKRYEDTTKTLYFDTKPTFTNVHYLIKYKETLKKRFEQKEMYITSSPITRY